MFTGIIETVGEVEALEVEGKNITFTITTPLAHELKIDQSVSHNGVCLTVVHQQENHYKVTAIDETLKKSNLGQLTIGSKVNLERCMPANGRFDGHIVQGHVDQTAECVQITEEDGSWLFDFRYDPAIGNLNVEKGSISVNGVSLTCFNTIEGGFTVAIIPYTYEHTNFHQLKAGETVNLEFDIIGKYVQRLLSKGA